MNYIVISLAGTQYHGCRIIPEHSIYLSIYFKAFGPASAGECTSWVIQNCRAIPNWWSELQADAEAKEANARISRSGGTIGVFAARECRRVQLARLDGIPETKIEWEGSLIKYPVLYTRTSELVAYAEFCAPSDLLGQFWGDIVGCAGGAATASIIAAIFASPAAALPAFKVAFVGCITAKVGNRVDDISIALGTEQKHGEWHRV
jgi:hypothetical protein